jgi:hypothetical protein
MTLCVAKQGIHMQRGCPILQLICQANVMGNLATHDVVSEFFHGRVELNKTDLALALVELAGPYIQHFYDLTGCVKGLLLQE